MPNVRNALKILQPATVIAWHRAGFRAYWRWKSRPRGGRPPASPEVRGLIREMSIANPLWGAPQDLDHTIMIETLYATLSTLRSREVLGRNGYLCVVNWVHRRLKPPRGGRKHSWECSAFGCIVD
jgi:hypothetical protein